MRLILLIGLISSLKVTIVSPESVFFATPVIGLQASKPKHVELTFFSYVHVLSSSIPISDVVPSPEKIINLSSFRLTAPINGKDKSTHSLLPIALGIVPKSPSFVLLSILRAWL